MQQPVVDTTDKSIDRSMNLVVVVYGLTLSAYFTWFVIFNKVPLSADSAHWGQFGDFVGGILNPLIAFSALFWLTRSVKLQKTELQETRKALEESAASQGRHANAAEKSMRIAAYTAIINAAVVENQTSQQYLLILINRKNLDSNTHDIRLMTGEFAKGEKLQQVISDVNSKIDSNNIMIKITAEKLRIELDFDV
jgi:hypothetical protein